MLSARADGRWCILSLICPFQPCLLAWGTACADTDADTNLSAHPHFLCVFTNRQMMSGVNYSAGAPQASPACLRIGDNPPGNSCLEQRPPTRGSKSKRGQKAGAPRQCFGPELFLAAELSLAPEQGPANDKAYNSRFLCQQVMMTRSSFAIDVAWSVALAL